MSLAITLQNPQQNATSYTRGARFKRAVRALSALRACKMGQMILGVKLPDSLWPGVLWCQMLLGVELPGFSLELLCEFLLGVDFYLI